MNTFNHCLFRQESIFHATSRLAGDVVLATPMPLRVYGIAFVVVVLIAVLFLTLSSYTRQEEVSGWLVPRGGIIRVTARSGGTIEKLLVKEGDFVRAGEPLAQIRLSTAIAGGKDSGEAVNSALASEAEAVQEQAAATKKTLLTEQTFIGPKIRRLKNQLAETRKQIVYQQEHIKIAEEDLKRFQVMAESRVVAERLVGDRRAALLTTQQNLSQLQAGAFDMQQQIADALSRQETIKAELAAADASAQSSSAQVTQKIVQNNAQSLDVAVSRVGGRVQAIPVEPGQNLASGAMIAIVTPKGARLEAELYAPSRAIGFIRPGQSVHLMYQAFPHEKFGAPQGQVISLSRTILSPSEVQIPGVDLNQPVFRVRVAVADQGVRAYGQYIPLQPGMLLNASIAFDRRSLLQWLFDPIYAVRK